MRRISALILTAVAVGVVAVSSAGAAGSASSLPTLTLTMTGKSIAVSGSLVSGAINVTSKVSTAAPASPTLVRLDPGVTFAQAFGAVARHGGDPNYLAGYAAIVFSGAAAHGTSTAQTVLTPGNYVALDTTNNNPNKWPLTQFTVAAAAKPASLPAAAATVKAIEFNFTGPSILHRGTVVRFVNGGFLVHMIVAVRVKDVATAKHVRALLLAGKDNRVQKYGLGFATFMGDASSGAVQQEVINEPAGVYVLACFMDTQDGREHTRLGMEKIIKIVK